MATLVDTYKLINQLKSRGFSEEQARGVSEAIQEIDLTQLATRADLRELELRMTVKMGAMVMALAAFLVALKYFG